jgi:hypothetical protein
VFAEVEDGGFGNTVPDLGGPDDFAGYTAGNIALLTAHYRTLIIANLADRWSHLAELVARSRKPDARHQ